MSAKPFLPSAVLAIALLPPIAFTAQEPVSSQPLAGGEPTTRSSRDRVAAFLAPYGPQNFSVHYIEALYTFLEADERYRLADYVGAKRVLDALWSRHPTGGADWAALPTKPFGINVGSPPCYYALRMLTDMTEWRVASGVTGSAAPRTARLTVLLVGETTGIEPRTVAEIDSGGGIPVVHALDPVLEQNSHAVVHQSLTLFREYCLAMTEGGLNVEVTILELPAVSLPVHAEVLPSGGYYAGLDDASAVFASVPAQLQKETDWWWILYPSHVPEQYPDFANAEFITGGMGVGPDGVSPFFIIDDRWLVRKPPHIGTGPYTNLERRAYLPQWLQHEFFHHLFRSWPEFGLEVTGHQWFDHANWPPDFMGTFEPDYYHEALVKRLQSATPSLKAGLRYATADAPWAQVGIADILGTYHRNPIENAWHIGDIQWGGGGQLIWRNTAPVQWNLTADPANGQLLTGPDCPYFSLPLGKQFQVLLERNALGDLTTEVEGFRFLGEVYEGAMIRVGWIRDSKSLVSTGNRQSEIGSAMPTWFD